MTRYPRILLVEDDEDDARLAVAAMQEAEVEDEVVVVPDGRQAVDYLFRRGAFEGRMTVQPSLVLLDLKLPRMDGFEVLETVKGDRVTRVIPVVVLTSSRHDRDILRAYQLGANGYVVKAIEFDDYIAAIAALVLFWTVVNEPPPCAGVA